MQLLAYITLDIVFSQCWRSLSRVTLHPVYSRPALQLKHLKACLTAEVIRKGGQAYVHHKERTQVHGDLPSVDYWQEWRAFICEGLRVQSLAAPSPR